MVGSGEQVIVLHPPVTWDHVPTERERPQKLLWANL